MLREGALAGGTFRLRHRLGAGGTGVVWGEGREPRARDVAIKLITREDCQTEDMREAFREEARALARVSRPRVDTRSEPTLVTPTDPSTGGTWP